MRPAQQALPPRVRVSPAPGPAPMDARVRPPGSKSITNRALLVAALAAGSSRITGALESDDTVFMLEALRALGIAVEADAGPGGAATALTVHGCGGRLPAAEASLYVGNAGTAARFLTPALLLGPGPYLVDGNERMRKRPIAPLVGALRALGARVDCLGEPDALPLRIAAGPADPAAAPAAPAAVEVSGSLSSQYTSGLLLTGPCLPGGLRLTVTGTLVSEPYLRMTAQVMAAFGARAEGGRAGGEPWQVAPGGYRATAYAVEPDASAASYFLAAAAITGGTVVVEGLGSESLQGDVGFAGILGQMGCEVELAPGLLRLTGPAPGGLRGVDVDMKDVSDTAQTLAVVAPFATGPTRVTGIGFIRGKETDRIGAVCTELRRLGIAAEEEPDGFVVQPGLPRPGVVHTYDDHRMAMSFALLGLRVPGIEIDDPGCVSKTYPGYFGDLVAATGCRVEPSA